MMNNYLLLFIQISTIKTIFIAPPFKTSVSLYDGNFVIFQGVFQLEHLSNLYLPRALPTTAFVLPFYFDFTVISFFTNVFRV